MMLLLYGIFLFWGYGGVFGGVLEDAVKLKLIYPRYRNFGLRAPHAAARHFGQNSDPLLNPDYLLDKHELRRTVCFKPPKYGSCDAKKLRFGYNPFIGACTVYLWSGCGGGDNRFVSQHDCFVRCGGVYLPHQYIPRHSFIRTIDHYYPKLIYNPRFLERIYLHSRGLNYYGISGLQSYAYKPDYYNIHRYQDYYDYGSYGGGYGHTYPIGYHGDYHSYYKYDPYSSKGHYGGGHYDNSYHGGSYGYTPYYPKHHYTGGYPYDQGYHGGYYPYDQGHHTNYHSGYYGNGHKGYYDIGNYGNGYYDHGYYSKGAYYGTGGYYGKRQPYGHHGSYYYNPYGYPKHNRYYRSHGKRKCGVNEIRAQCGRICTCDQLALTKKCIRGCANKDYSYYATDCYCIEGYVRDLYTSKCVPEGRCRNCGPNEVLAKKGRICTCEQFKNDGVCVEGESQIGEACFCGDGFVRTNGPYSHCAPEDHCEAYAYPDKR